MSSNKLDHPGIALAIALLALGATGFVMMLDSRWWVFWPGAAFCFGAAVITGIRYAADLNVLFRSRSLALLDSTLTIVSVCILLELAAPILMIIARYSGASEVHTGEIFDNKISVRCADSMRPYNFRPDKMIRIVQVIGPPTSDEEKKFVVANTGFIQGDGQINWIGNNIDEAYKCTLTNYGNEPVFGVQLSLYIEWRETIYVNGELKSDTEINHVNFMTMPVDLGTSADNTDYFYVMNHSTKYVLVRMPDAVFVRAGNSDVYQNVKLIKANYPMEAVTILPPRPPLPQPSTNPPTPPPPRQ